MSMKNLLIDERPIVVLPSLVRCVGYSKAIILQQIHWLCGQPKSGTVLDDGETWIWNSYAEWQEDFFPWMSVTMIQRHVRELESEGFLLHCQPKKGQWDRTKFYRVNTEKVRVNSRFVELAQTVTIDDSQKCIIDSDSKCIIDVPHKCMFFKGTETSTETSTEKTTDIRETDGNRPIAAMTLKPRSDFQCLMDYHANRIGTILDGGAQGKAIKKLLKYFTVDECIACYEYQLTSWREAVSWLTVASGSGIAQWKANGSPARFTEKTNGKLGNAEILEQYGRYFSDASDNGYHQLGTSDTGMGDAST